MWPTDSFSCTLVTKSCAYMHSISCMHVYCTYTTTCILHAMKVKFGLEKALGIRNDFLWFPYGNLNGRVSPQKWKCFWPLCYGGYWVSVDVVYISVPFLQPYSRGRCFWSKVSVVTLSGLEMTVQPLLQGVGYTIHAVAGLYLWVSSTECCSPRHVWSKTTLLPFGLSDLSFSDRKHLQQSYSYIKLRSHFHSKVNHPGCHAGLHLLSHCRGIDSKPSEVVRKSQSFAEGWVAQTKNTRSSRCLTVNRQRVMPPWVYLPMLYQHWWDDLGEAKKQ